MDKSSKRLQPLFVTNEHTEIQEKLNIVMSQNDTVIADKSAQLCSNHQLAN